MYQDLSRGIKSIKMHLDASRATEVSGDGKRYQQYKKVRGIQCIKKKIFSIKSIKDIKCKKSL